MARFKRKNIESEPFQLVKDSSGRVVRVIFPHPVEFGFENDSQYPGEVTFKNADPVDSSGGSINSKGGTGTVELTSSAIGLALGFTPANEANTARSDLSNVAASDGRSALGVNGYVTGSLTDLFGNLNSTQIGSALGFTPADVSSTIRTDLSNAPTGILNSSVTKSSLGLGSVENKSASDIIGEITDANISIALGFTPANVANTARSDFSNVSASSGRSALGIGDHVTGSLTDIFGNLNSTTVINGLGFTPINTNLSNAPSTILNSNITPISLGLGNVENKSASDIIGEITNTNIATALGFTPANVSNTARTDLSNVSASAGRSALGISNHATGSLSDIFGNLNSTAVINGLGFTPINTSLSNAPSTILNSNITPISLGLGNVENKSSATIRGEISSADVTGGLGFTPIDVALSNAPAGILNTNITKSSIGLGNVENKSSAAIRGEIQSSDITTGLGFTPIDVALSNAPSGILNTNVTKSSIGLGNVENKSSSAIRSEIDSSNVGTALGYTPANITGANFSASALSNIITSGKGANGYSIEYDEVGGFASGDNNQLLKVGASGVVGQRNINISTIYNSVSTTTITSDNAGGYALTVENDSVGAALNPPRGIKITMDNANTSYDTGYFLYATIRGSQHYYVKSDGDGTSTVSLTFTGTHNVSCLKDSDMIPGMIVECTGQTWIKNTDLNGEIVSYSTCLPRVKLSDTLGSKKVFGVLSIDNNKTNYEGKENQNYLGVAPGSFPGLVEKHGIDSLDIHAEVMSLGEGCIWVTDYNGNIGCGDLIISSPIKGYGCLQDDDIMRSKTVAKSTESIDWDSVSEIIDHEGISYKKYLVSCTFHCG
jgi:NADH/NAD ratio-sensing transcriptional regulator Rex